MDNNSKFYSNFPDSINKPMQSVEPTYDNFIIKPPDRNVTHGHISEKFVVDSRDRDNIMYPNSNNYKINVPEEYRNVTSVELSLAQIPNSGYNVTINNNAIYIQEGHGKHCDLIKVLVDPGKYTDSSLIDALNGEYGDLFETSGLFDKYNFHHDKNTKKLRIQSNRESKKDFYYNINYIDGCHGYNCLSNSENIRTTGNDNINKIFGFKNKQYTSIIGGIILSTKNVKLDDFTQLSDSGEKLKLLTIQDGHAKKDLRVGDYLKITKETVDYNIKIYKILSNTKILIEQIDKDNISNGSYTLNPINVLFSEITFDVECPDYIILDIPEFNKLDGNKESIIDSFAIILQNNKCQTIINNSNISTDKEIKYYNPPESRLISFHVVFKRYNGELYDFNGQDHLLVFNITCLNQPGKYNNFVPSLSF